MELLISIEVDRVEHSLRVSCTDFPIQHRSYRTHRRLVLAARRALRTDAGLQWQLNQGGFRLMLGPAEFGAGHLAARMCLPYLMQPIPSTTLSVPAAWCCSATSVTAPAVRR